MESKYGNFEDIKKLELNGFLDLDTAITVKESKDKKVKIVTTSSQIDILTADFNVFSRDEYCRDKEYLNKLFNCASFIQDKQIKYELQDCVKLVYKKYRVFSDNTAEIDLIKWVVMSNYILPIK